MSDPTQTAAVNSLLTDSADTVSTKYTEAVSAARLSTVSNILNQKFGSAWKIILILILTLVLIAFVVIFMIY